LVPVEVDDPPSESVWSPDSQFQGLSPSAATRTRPAPVEVTSDEAGPYLRVLADLVPAAAHVTEQYANTGSKLIMAG
jgi:hypothetical protein